MGRPKQFDVDHALEEAKELFWAKGYAETSVSELEERLALGRQSIYGTFGGKHELFLKALDRYLDRQPESREVLWRDEVGIAEIHAFLSGVVTFLSDGNGRACFLVNTALSGGDDDGVRQRCGRNQDHLVASFTHALRGAEARGELDGTTDVTGTALFLASLTFGLNVMAKNGASSETLNRTVDAALAGLR